jgi:hypothetical protein
MFFAVLIEDVDDLHRESIIDRGDQEGFIVLCIGF